MARLKPEGYIVASSSRDLGNGVITIYAADGVPPNRQVTDVFPPDVPTPNTGLHYACYALLEQFGAAFLHPLDPFIPSDVKLSTYVSLASPHDLKGNCPAFSNPKSSCLCTTASLVSVFFRKSPLSGPFAAGTTILSILWTLRTS